MSTLTYKEEDGNLLVHYYQDVEPHIIAAARARRAQWENRFNRRSELRLAMSVPNNIVLEVAAKLGIPFGDIFEKEKQARIWRELKGRDYSLFRTTNAKRF